MLCFHIWNMFSFSEHSRLIFRAGDLISENSQLLSLWTMKDRGLSCSTQILLLLHLQIMKKGKILFQIISKAKRWCWTKVKEDAFSSNVVTCKPVKDLNSSDSHFCLKYKNNLLFRRNENCDTLTHAWSFLDIVWGRDLWGVNYFCKITRGTSADLYRPCFFFFFFHGERNAENVHVIEKADFI